MTDRYVIVDRDGVHSTPVKNREMSDFDLIYGKNFLPERQRPAYRIRIREKAAMRPIKGDAPMTYADGKDYVFP
jgi:hypothetical protein